MGRSPVTNPELALTKGRYAAPFRSALLHAIEELCSEDRNLLRMYLVSHCSLSQIARAYAVHRATAARRLVRARSLVFESVRRQLRAQGGALTDREFASIARAVQSQLDVDLIACLDDESPDARAGSFQESASRSTA